MILFADTNWLVGAYFVERDDERTTIIERFARKHDLPWLVSHIVLLEARNVFGWAARELNPKEWRQLEADFGSRVLVDVMNWDLQRRRTMDLFQKYSHKAQIGTFDVALVGSALLAGATHFLSFDSKARALAAAERLIPFPALSSAERRLLSALR